MSVIEIASQFLQYSMKVLNKVHKKTASLNSIIVNKSYTMTKHSTKVQ